MKAIVVESAGGPEVLVLRDIPEPTLRPGELLVDSVAAGVNFLDVYFRRGSYPVPFPFTPGDEGVGYVRTRTADFAAGDRVVWSGGRAGYAEVVAAPAATTVRLPADISNDDAFVFAQGLTAHYLVRSITRLEAGMTAFVHAAAGGVGLLLVRILKIHGIRVIAGVSTEAKAIAVREAGADTVLVYDDGDLRERTLAANGGAGVNIVYDGVGAATFNTSITLLARRGTMVLFGAPSGPVPPIDVMSLAFGGSLSLIRPGLPDYIATRAELEGRVEDLFGWIRAGLLPVRIDGHFPLAAAPEAHRAIEGRSTIGKLVLVTRDSIP